MQKYYQKYARLMLQAGVNLQPGQKVHVAMESYHLPFAKVVVEEAYKLGASYVLLDAGNPEELAARVNHSSEENLSYVPGWIEQRNKVMIEENWARLFFFGSIDPDLNSTLDQDKLSIVQSQLRKVNKPIGRACGEGKLAWAGAALPTPKWANQVFPDETPEKAMELLWQAIADIVQLDHEDPAALWKDISSNTIKRGKKLAELNLAHVHFKGPGTDLTVQCLPNNIWAGGSSSHVDGYEYIPNVPTFENFTTPDYRGTKGKMQVTCPVEVLGTSVEGAWFVFEDGKVTDYGADKNKQALDQMFAICPQAAYLGELALVDGSSPIFRSGITFHSVLFDENATCHVALGNGYANAAADAEGKSDEELMEMGVNVSLLHHDFMIGSDEVDVDGITESGEVIPLIRNGLYTEIVR